MTTKPANVAEARAAAERARARLMATAQELQYRLSPATIARNGWQSAKEKGADLAEDAVDAVKRRPATAGGIVAAIALFLAREPIIDAAGRVIDGASAKRQTRRTRKTDAKQAAVDGDDETSSRAGHTTARESKDKSATEISQ